MLGHRVGVLFLCFVAMFGGDFMQFARGQAVPDATPEPGADTIDDSPQLLLHFDTEGRFVDLAELSELKRSLVNHSATDVLILAHGWNNTQEDAVARYGQLWRNIRTAGSIRSQDEFRPLIVGLVWPSKAWVHDENPSRAHRLSGDNTQPRAVDSFRPAILDVLDPKIDPDGYALDVERLAVLLAEPMLSDDQVRSGMQLLSKYAGDGRQSVVPMEERSSFAGNLAGTSSRFGNVDFKDVFRVFTFWQMKHRSGVVGQGFAPALIEMTAYVNKGVRFHFVGHSFGAKLVLEALTSAGSQLCRPVDSVTLLQGALSAYAFADVVPGYSVPGGYRPALSTRVVRGPIVATYTDEDYPLTWAFPLGTRLVSDTGEFAARLSDVPHYDALGSTGVVGLSTPASMLNHEAAMLPVGSSYGFKEGKVYDVRATSIHGHSDLDHPEVGWLIWNGIRVESPRAPLERLTGSDTLTGSQTKRRPTPAGTEAPERSRPTPPEPSTKPRAITPKSTRIVFLCASTSNVQGNPNLDLNRVTDLFRLGAEATNVEFHDTQHVVGVFGRNGLRSVLDQGPSNLSDSTLVCYLKLHGTTINREHVMRLDRTAGAAREQITSSELVRLLRQQAARFTVLITESCTAADIPVEAVAPSATGFPSELFADLFVRPHGLLNINSASYLDDAGGLLNQYAWMDGNANAVFTAALTEVFALRGEPQAEMLEATRDTAGYTWKSFFAYLREQTDRRFQFLKRDFVKDYKQFGGDEPTYRAILNQEHQFPYVHSFPD